MNSKFNYYWLLLLIPVAFVCWFLISKNENKPSHFLGYFGPKNAQKASDTSYHTIPAFSFTNQNNVVVNNNTVHDKIYVTEFFFTTCQSICPVMNRHLDRVYSYFKNDNDVLILSHTVDPENDSVATLKNYAAQHAVNDNKWLFLTGSKKDLYDIARKGYLLDASEGKGDAEDFIHTQNFALVDKELHIRGYYDGTDSLEVERMIKEIELLKKEYDFKNNNN